MLFLATNASCVLTSFSRQWTTGVRGHHIAHIVYVPLCVCVSPSALVFFVSLYLSVIVFVFLFLGVSEQHLIPLSTIVMFGIHSSSLCLSV